jgi:thiazole/oxazole-forming peptide maturase SagC family component
MTKLTDKVPKQPRVRISYHIIPMSDDRVQLRSGSDAFIMQGKSVHDLLNNLFPLLTGEYHIESIIKKMSGDFPRESIISFIQKLTQRRVIEDASLEPTVSVDKKILNSHQEQLIYFSHFSKEFYDPQARLYRSRVGVLGLGALGIRVACALASSGIGTIIGIDSNDVSQADVDHGHFYFPDVQGLPRGKVFPDCGHKYHPETSWVGIDNLLKDRDDFTINFKGLDYLLICLESFQPWLYEQINLACLELNLIWTWCGIDGHEGMIGPTVIPWETACWKCYDLRVKANIDHYEEYMAYEDYLFKRKTNKAQFGYLLPSIDFLAGLTSLEVVKDLSGITPPLTYGTQLAVDLLSTQFELHPVLKVPRCPACGRLEREGAIVRPFLEQ